MSDRIAQLERLLEAEPEDAFCLYGLAQEYIKLGEMERAISYFDRTIAADPDHCYAYFHKARCQEEAGDAAGTRQTLETGLVRAKATGDQKAIEEISEFLETLA